MYSKLALQNALKKSQISNVSWLGTADIKIWLYTVLQTNNNSIMLGKCLNTYSNSKNQNDGTTRRKMYSYTWSKYKRTTDINPIQFLSWTSLPCTLTFLSTLIPPEWVFSYNVSQSIKCINIFTNKVLYKVYSQSYISIFFFLNSIAQSIYCV